MDNYLKCRNCGYDLRDTPTDVCPECGEANPPTEDKKRQPSMLERWAVLAWALTLCWYGLAWPVEIVTVFEWDRARFGPYLKRWVAFPLGDADAFSDQIVSWLPLNSALWGVTLATLYLVWEFVQKRKSARDDP